MNPIGSAPRGEPGVGEGAVTVRGSGGRGRYHASAAQLQELIPVFEEHPSPSEDMLQALSAKLGMPLRSLVLWFKNRRARHGKRKDWDVDEVSGEKKGRRRYVKSGIYAKSANKGMFGEAEGRGRGSRIAGDAFGTPTVPVPGIGEVGEKRRLGVEVRAFGGDNVMEYIDTHEDGSVGNPIKRLKVEDKFVELLGDENPCASWDSAKCERVCMDFFKQKSAMSAKSTTSSQKQIALAHIVADRFFNEEMQSGITLTSHVQDLDTALKIIGEIMATTTDPETQETLKSGSKALLREFIFQIRTGKAVEFATAPPVPPIPPPVSSGAIASSPSVSTQ